jgi:hypothetical protein
MWRNIQVDTAKNWVKVERFEDNGRTNQEERLSTVVTIYIWKRVKEERRRYRWEEKLGSCKGKMDVGVSKTIIEKWKNIGQGWEIKKGRQDVEDYGKALL